MVLGGPSAWNKTPASSWNFQKQVPALKGRSLQELELSLAYAGYHNEETSLWESSEMGFRADSSLNRIAGVQTMGNGQAHRRGRRDRRAKIVPRPSLDSRFRTENQVHYCSLRPLRHFCLWSDRLVERTAA